MSVACASLSAQGKGTGMAIDTLGFPGKELCGVLQLSRVQSCPRPVETSTDLAADKQEALA